MKIYVYNGKQSLHIHLLTQLASVVSQLRCYNVSHMQLLARNGEPKRPIQAVNTSGWRLILNTL